MGMLDKENPGVAIAGAQKPSSHYSNVKCNDKPAKSQPAAPPLPPGVRFATADEDWLLREIIHGCMAGGVPDDVRFFPQHDVTLADGVIIDMDFVGFYRPILVYGWRPKVLHDRNTIRGIYERLLWGRESASFLVSALGNKKLHPEIKDPVDRRILARDMTREEQEFDTLVRQLIADADDPRNWKGEIPTSAVFVLGHEIKIGGAK